MNEEKIINGKNTHRIIQGDCIEGMRTLADQSVQCCVTSPPYWGLRDYGHDGQIGLEATMDAYVARMVEVFREVRRVLRDDGTLWLNLGDSYASTPVGSFNGGGFKDTSALNGTRDLSGVQTSGKMNKLAASGLKPKDLCGIPWRVAFALQSDGWWLRQDIIWHKTNPMPESVTDRCTKGHEYLFLLSKQPKYYFDFEAMKEPSQHPGVVHRVSKKGKAHTETAGLDTRPKTDWVTPETRNRRSVWTIPSKPNKHAHFATMPPALAEPCVLAGCPEGGIVLDPFTGSGTTAIVALNHGRKFIGTELNPEYVKIAETRIADEVKTNLTGVLE